LVVAALILLFDQLSKYWITGPLALPDRAPIELLSIFRLIFVANEGVSMGFLTAGSGLERWLLVVLTAGIAIGVLVWLWREKSRVEAMALGLILGGAIGNILDRIRLGYVVDFLNLHFGAWSPFLVFNLADAAISIGVALLVLRALVTRDAPAPTESINEKA
jgi:signal peptidase II